MFRYGVVLSLLLVSNRIGLGADNPPVELRYQFHQGEVVRYDVSLRDDYIVQAAGFYDAPFTDHHSVKQFRVVKVNDDGSAVLELMFESVRVKIQENDETFRFDSTTDDVAPAKLAPLAGMVGKPYLRVTLSPTGQVAAIQPINSIGSADDVDTAALDVLLKLPEDPISVGESWRDDSVIEIAVPHNPMLKRSIKVQRRYYFKSLADGIATIELKTMIISPISDPEEELQLIRRKPKGTFVLDLNRGVLLSKHLIQDNLVTGFGGGAGGAVMTFKQKQLERLLPAETGDSLSNSEQ